MENRVWGSVKPATRARLERYAAARGRSVSSVVAEAVKALLDAAGAS